jgi:hypothetical protein
LCSASTVLALLFLCAILQTFCAHTRRL